MNLFSISQLAQFSGVKPHTIRVWEQRYGALKPERSDGNTRYYNGDQLRRLLNIVSLLEAKYKVSTLCALTDDQLSILIQERKHGHVNIATEYFVSQLIAAGMAYDELLFQELFENCIAKYGLVQTYTIILYPMLVRIGLMWSSNTIPSVQEHFISNIVRQKILRSIDSLPLPGSDRDKWVLFLPEDEFHEIGLLFAAFIIRQSGEKVVYLGSSVSVPGVIRALKDINPTNLLVFLVRNNLIEDVQNYLGELNNLFEGQKIYVAGNYKLLSQIEYPKKVQWIQNIDSLERQLTFYPKNQ